MPAVIEIRVPEMGCLYDRLAVMPVSARYRRGDTGQDARATAAVSAAASQAALTSISASGSGISASNGA